MTVRSLFKSAALVPNDHAPPLPLKVKELNLLLPVMEPENVLPVAEPFIVTTPLLWVKVPLLLQLPATCRVVDGAVTVPAVMVKSLSTSAAFVPNDHAPPMPSK